MSSIVFLLILVVVALLIWRLYSKFKIPKTNCLSLVTGGVKSGKSTLSVYLAISNYKRRLFVWKVKKAFCKLFNKPIAEMPLLYSNVPLKCNFVLLTQNVLLRKVRIRYGSVVYIQEASLVADSMLIKDKDTNNALLLFNKLFGHESKGGLLVYDTQCILDVHYAVKRSLANYFYIHHKTTIPFFVLLKVRELMYSDDGSAINTITGDLEDNLKTIVIPKSIWKKFDCYCYSIFTDDLPVSDTIVDGKRLYDLKCRSLVSFRSDFNFNIDSTKGVVHIEKK